jgi:acyl-coenzyme A thioesterase PaaI-like protein
MYYSAAWFKFILNLYPPYFATGIKLEYLSKDWKSARVIMKLRWYNKNAVGSHFGGSLYSMVDPHVMLLLMPLLGKRYYVWDKSAHIEYISAAKEHVYADINITDEDIELIKHKTAAGEKYLPEFSITIKDKQGKLVAVVKKELYVRLKPEFRPNQSIKSEVYDHTN